MKKLILITGSLFLAYNVHCQSLDELTGFNNVSDFFNLSMDQLQNELSPLVLENRGDGLYMVRNYPPQGGGFSMFTVGEKVLNWQVVYQFGNQRQSAINIFNMFVNFFVRNFGEPTQNLSDTRKIYIENEMLPENVFGIILDLNANNIITITWLSRQ